MPTSSSQYHRHQLFSRIIFTCDMNIGGTASGMITAYSTAAGSIDAIIYRSETGFKAGAVFCMIFSSVNDPIRITFTQTIQNSEQFFCFTVISSQPAHFVIPGINIFISAPAIPFTHAPVFTYIHYSHLLYILRQLFLLHQGYRYYCGRS